MSAEDDRDNENRDAQPDSGRDDESSEQKPDKPPIYKRPLFWIIGGAIIAVVIVGAILYYLHSRKYESTDNAFVDAHILRLQPQISGRLTWVADADNRHVKAGQLLAKIEPTTPLAKLQQARAGLAEADAAVKRAQGSLVAARAQVEQARANAAAPRAEAANAARDLARYRDLEAIDDNAVAATQLDAARAQARSTAAQAEAAQQQIATARAQVVVAERALDAARAQRKAAQAQVTQARDTVSDLTVSAPIAGQVVNRSVTTGSTVSPQTQLMAIVPDHVWITANFKETQITEMKRGDPVDIKVDAFPELHFHGHVDSIQRGAGQAFALLPPQNATGNFVKVVQRVPVRIEFDREAGGADWRKYPIGPGMSAVPTVKVR
ncbi:HlyD family secretion protein [Stakelama saccharophila]|uniref:HlyD family secretion protein n=1 Tax=Stakelama saccharophila TaxID=3075605 RepID=A0ABZ0BD01_9SPHN|nr:HlyD family secretion protein [Stakelama sp. W311]WNO55067.1 HlyD family secretion protein [Stakelama sp. W311]